MGLKPRRVGGDFSVAEWGLLPLPDDGRMRDSARSAIGVGRSMSTKNTRLASLRPLKQIMAAAQRRDGLINGRRRFGLVKCCGRAAESIAAQNA